MLGPGVDEQGQAQLGHPAVERREAFVGRVDELDRGQPFDEDRVVGRRPVQASQGVGAVGIDAGAEEQVGVARRQRGDELVRHVELGARRVQVAPVIHRAVQRQDHGAADVPALAEHRGKPVGAQGIALLFQLPAGDAKAAEIEPHLPAPAQPLGDKAPAAARAQAGHMAVQVQERRDRQRLGWPARPAEKRHAAREGEQEHRSQRQRGPAATVTPHRSPARVASSRPDGNPRRPAGVIERNAATIEQGDDSMGVRRNWAGGPAMEGGVG